MNQPTPRAFPELFESCLARIREPMGSSSCYHKNWSRFNHAQNGLPGPNLRRRTNSPLSLPYRSLLSSKIVRSPGRNPSRYPKI